MNISVKDTIKIHDIIKQLEEIQTNPYNYNRNELYKVQDDYIIVTFYICMNDYIVIDQFIINNCNSKLLKDVIQEYLDDKL